MTSTATVVAVDGGNSKTDLVIADADGSVLARLRGPASSPHILGVPGAIELLDQLITQAKGEAGLDADAVFDRSEIYLAGADLPVEVDILMDAVGRTGWARDNRVDNDTFALMRAGTDAIRAIGVVCGAGINCVGRDADGHTARFPALGMITGDWGGGHHLAQLALYHAARGEDGRGPQTKLAEAVADHFGAASVEALGISIHLEEIDSARISELTPVLFEVAATGDPVAQRLVSKQVDEVIALASVAADRLGMREQELTVVLGGGVLTARHPLLHEPIVSGLTRALPRCDVVVLEHPPVAGAALFGLEALGSPASAMATLRRALG